MKHRTDKFASRTPSPLSLPEFVRRRLQQPLPGFAAQKLMGPHFEDGRLMHDELPPEDCRVNAVMLLLYEKAGHGQHGSYHLPLTVRSPRLPSHAGEISFPGGRMDPGETPLETALRETEEEIGVARHHIEPLGSLSDLYIPVSGNIIKPQVGLLLTPPVFKPHLAEVSRLFTPSVRQLRDSANKTKQQWMFEGKPLTVPFWNMYDVPLWGATAMILSEFTELLHGQRF